MQRGLALVAVIALLVTSLLSILHQHSDHGTSEARCAACVVAHHVGALSATTLAPLPPTDAREVVLAPVVAGPMLRRHAPECGRAPPTFLSA